MPLVSAYPWTWDDFWKNTFLSPFGPCLSPQWPILKHFQMFWAAKNTMGSKRAISLWLSIPSSRGTILENSSSTTF